MADERVPGRERAALAGVAIAVAVLVADLQLHPPDLSPAPGKEMVRPTQAAPR